MIRKGQVLHREGVTSRWQVRHCQKNQNKKSTKKGQSQSIMYSWWSPVRLLSRTPSWWDFLDFFPRNMGSNDAVLLLKIYPSMSKEDPAWRLWQLAVVGSSLGSVTGAIQVWHPPVPLHDWSRLSNWLLPVWTCLWMTTSFLPKCVFSFSETWWPWQIADENAHIYSVIIWCAGWGKQDTAV